MTILFETILTKANFCVLFLTTFLYWFNSSFLLSTKWVFLPSIFLWLSTLLQICFLSLRWVSSGHFPISNLYESLLFLSCILTTFLLYLNFKLTTSNTKLNLKTKLHKTTVLIQNTEQRFIKSLPGSLLTPIILLINTFATFSLPIELKTATALVPALQSNWLLMHVTVMLLSYGFLLCGCLFAIAYLIITFFLTTNDLEQMEFQGNSTGETKLDSIKPLKLTLKSSSNIFVNEKFKKIANTLDNLSYRVLGLGFPLLTIGLLSGAVWANQTWGSYWSWDPKETWALITWLIFAIYLHTRLSRGWSGRKSAFLASFGFVIIWVCYLGVNLMGKGLHSYGFFN